jgi:hypothetical protein
LELKKQKNKTQFHCCEGALKLILEVVLLVLLFTLSMFIQSIVPIIAAAPGSVAETSAKFPKKPPIGLVWQLL